MAEVRKGDKVKVHYKGTLADGTVFDSSEKNEPLEFVVGSGQVIQGFDEAMIGMGVGESKAVDIPVEKAYGTRDESMVMVVPVDQVPPDLDPEVGLRLEMGGANGEIIRVVVVDIDANNITLDANPPLAGKELTFSIELVECTAA
jgi:peptidylprolyl isomerase